MPSIFFVVYAGVVSLLDSTRTRLGAVREDDRGASVVEWVIITAVVVGLAIAIGVAITALVNGRIGQIV